MVPAMVAFYLLHKAENIHQRYSAKSKWKVELLNQKKLRQS
jgi:hypothetical protein